MASIRVIDPIRIGQPIAVSPEVTGIKVGPVGPPGPQGQKGDAGAKGDKGDPGGWVASNAITPGTHADTITTPGLYALHIAGHTPEFGWPADVTNMEGHLEVIGIASIKLQRITHASLALTNQTHRAIYERTYYAGNWSPWRKIAFQGWPGGGDLVGTGSPIGTVSAPPGAYYTDTAGTAGAWRWLKTSSTGSTGWEVVHGDTGWRNMAALASPEFDVTQAGTWALVRRIGSVVHYFMKDIVIPEPGSNATIFTVPTGWRPFSTRSFSVYSPTGANGWVLSNGGVSYPRPSGAAGGKVTAHFEYVTDNPWPTALPGTPA